MSDPRQSLGQRAEALVVERLRAAGYTILDRNWRHGKQGELDIVARHGDTLVFVEVRARRGPLQESIDYALESVNARKRNRLIRLAEAYLAVHGWQAMPCRITVVAVAFQGEAVSMEIIKDAVEW